MMIISLIFFVLASICNSAMDCVSFHFSTSIFSKLNSQYFNPSISWLNKYNEGNPTKGMRKIFFGLFNYPVALTDFWHCMKSLMIIFICASIATFKGYTIYQFEHEWLNIALAIIIYGTLWNLFFSLFFNYVFKK